MNEVSTRTTLVGPSAGVTRAWMAVGLLFLFMLINFADKAVLGLAAVPIMQELELSHTEFGLIGASFFTFFSLGAVVVGFLVNRVDTKWVLATLVLIWSLCQLPMLLPLSAAALIVSRVVLGFSEGPAYPVALHAAYKWFPPEHRAVPTSVIAIGALAGNGIVAPAIVWIITSWSWRAAFAVLGAVGLVWCATWLALFREGPLGADATISGERNARASYRQLLGCRTVIGVQIVGFAAYWLLTLAVIWLPAFLNEGLGYTSIDAGWIVMLVALCQILLLPIICAFSERLRRRGTASRLAYGWIASGCSLAAGLLTILLAQTAGSFATIACTVLAFSLGNVIFVLGPVLIAEVTPIGQRGAVLGISNAITTLAGPLAPAVMGVIVDLGADPADGFRTAFAVAGTVVIVGALAGFALIVPEADHARFAARPRRRDAPPGEQAH
jgi:MFS transporter, ACS family, D-galactonate transporter